MNSIKISLLPIALLCTFIVKAHAQDLDLRVDSILQNHAKAIGMQQRKNIKTLISIGSISQMGSKMQVSILQKRPDKYRMNVHLEQGHISQAYDGNKGWMLNPFVSPDTVEITGMELKQLVESAIFDGILFNATALHYSLSYGGEDNIVTTPSYVLILKKPNGDRMKFFIDKKSYLIRRTEAKLYLNGFPVEAFSTFKDYRNIHGIIFPFMIENTNGQLTTRIRFDTVRINEKIDNRLFLAPKNF